MKIKSQDLFQGLLVLVVWFMTLNLAHVEFGNKSQSGKKFLYMFDNVFEIFTYIYVNCMSLAQIISQVMEFSSSIPSLFDEVFGRNSPFYNVCFGPQLSMSTC